MTQSCFNVVLQTTNYEDASTESESSRLKNSLLTMFTSDQTFTTPLSVYKALLQ